MRPVLIGLLCLFRWAMMRCSGLATPPAAARQNRFGLQSGDVVVMGGAARLIYHGVDRVRGWIIDLAAQRWPDQSDAARGGIDQFFKETGLEFLKIPLL